VSDLVAATATSSGGGAVAIMLLITLAIALFEIAATWKIFTKAGEPGWKTLIPIYNAVVFLRIVGKSGWWILLFIIPVVNFIAAVIVMNELSRSFGRSGGFTIGLVFLGFIFLPILGFGSDAYAGPGGGRMAQPLMR
jgi:uncharacterized membrane protein YhaH (DUF805 family)